MAALRLVVWWSRQHVWSKMKGRVKSDYFSPFSFSIRPATKERKVGQKSSSEPTYVHASNRRDNGAAGFARCNSLEASTTGKKNGNCVFLVVDGLCWTLTAAKCTTHTGIAFFFVLCLRFILFRLETFSRLSVIFPWGFSNSSLATRRFFHF